MKPTPRDVRWIAERLDGLSRDVQNLQNRKPGLAYSSIEDGAIREYDKDGVLGSQTGKQPDGTHGNVVLNGPKPPKPADPDVTAVPGMLEGRWNGKFAGDVVSPLDLKHVAMYAVLAGEVLDLSKQAGVMTGELGDNVQVQVDPGVYNVYLVSWSKAGRFSDAAGPVPVLVPVAADMDAIQDALDDLDERYDGVITEAGNLGTRLDTAETDLDLAGDRLDEAGTRLDTVFGEVAAIPGAISTAKQQAITAAASDAQTKADAALAAANTQIGQIIARGQNLVRNGDFEAGTDGWLMRATTTISQAESRSGSRSLRLEPTVASNAYVNSATVNTVAGRSYYIEVWVKSPGGTPAERDAASVAVLVAPDGSAVTTIAYLTSEPANAAGWARRFGVHTLPAGSTVGVQFGPWVSRNYTGAVFMDDFVAFDVTEAKEALDKAAAAQFDASAAMAKAGTAQSTADNALTMAGSATKAYYSTSPPSGVARTDRDIWRQINASKDVIGEWFWDATLTTPGWVKTLVSSQAISNLDVGKLTVGTGIISDLVAEHIAGRSARFIQLDVSQLVAVTGTMSEAVITKLFTDVVMSRKITTQMLAIGAFDNLVVDPDFTDTALRAQRLAASSATITAFGTSADNGRAHAIIPVSAGQLGFKMIATEPGRGTPVAPGATYRIRYQARAASGTAGTRPAVTCYKADGASAFTSVDSGAYVTVGTSWQWVDYTWTAPDDAAAAFFDVQRQAGLTGILWARTPQVTRMNAGELVVDGSITAASLAARAVTTDKLDATAIDGMVITGAIIQSPGTGAGYQLTAGGYTSRDAHGNVTVRLPTNGDPNQFKGDIEAQSLTVSGRASLQSANNEIASGATLVLEAGTTPPLTPPTVGAYYAITPFAPLPAGESARGLAYAQGMWWRGVRRTASSLGRIEGLNSGGAVTVSYEIVEDPINGLTAIGNTLYLLGTRNARPANERWVVAYNVTTTAVTWSHFWQYTSYGSGTYQPGIGTDGTNVFITQSDANGKVIWRSFNKTTGAELTLVESAHNIKSDMAGIYKGVADWGADRVVLSKTNGTTEVYTAAGVHQSAVGWFNAGQRQTVGLAWANGKFWHLQPDTLIGYSGILAPSGAGVGDTDDWWIAATWRGAGGVETTIGPPQRFTFMRRSELQLSAGTLPGGATGVRFYLARKASTPVRADFHLLATVTGTTTRITALPANWATAALPPATNTFSAASPGIIRSRANNFQVDGAGAGKWGPLTFHPDGTMTSSAVPAWIPITSFQSGCTVGDFGFVPAYRSWPDGKVELRGVVKGTLDVFKSIFGLPFSVRPAQAVSFVAATSASGGEPAVMRVELGGSSLPDNMTIQPQGTTRTWVSLDGIYYYQV